MGLPVLSLLYVWKQTIWVDIVIFIEVDFLYLKPIYIFFFNQKAKAYVVLAEGGALLKIKCFLKS